MKKIYLSLIALFACMSLTTASAQTDDFSLKNVTVGGAVAEFEPDTWYFLYQGRPGGGGWGDYTLLEVGEVPTSGGFMTDCGVGNNLLKKSVNDVPEGSSASAVAAYLVRFLPTADPGAYNIQFGTGNYLTAPDGTGNSRTLTTATTIYDAGKYNIYNIDPDEIGRAHV